MLSEDGLLDDGELDDGLVDDGLLDEGLPDEGLPACALSLDDGLAMLEPDPEPNFAFFST